MVQQLNPDNAPEVIIYPESDGQPMADNTLQLRWIFIIKENLELLFAERSDVFVAGDLLWYPTEGDNNDKQAPDAMVAFGRPKGDRGSYKQWEENNIAPQVVFEILSPRNYKPEMDKKFQFYQRCGVEEYYIYNPKTVNLQGFRRTGNKLEKIENINGWTSPLLGIRFVLKAKDLEVFYPDGEKFLTFVELAQLQKQDRKEKEAAISQLAQERMLREQERQRAEQEQQRAEQERQRAEQEQSEKEAAITQLEQERQQYQQLLEQLRERGIDIEGM